MFIEHKLCLYWTQFLYSFSQTRFIFILGQEPQSGVDLPPLPPRASSRLIALESKNKGAAIDIQTVIRAKQFSKPCFLKPSGAENFCKWKFFAMRLILTNFHPNRSYLAIFRAFEISHAVWISRWPALWVEPPEPKREVLGRAVLGARDPQLNFRQGALALLANFGP